MKTVVRESESWEEIANRTLGDEDAASAIQHLNGGAETPPQGSTVEVVGWDGTDRTPTDTVERDVDEEPVTVPITAPLQTLGEPAGEAETAESIDVDAPPDETPAARDKRRAAKKK